ncbi:MAG: hypothetical protein M3138_06720 [Actinomycetota bacterium]|nr:hypothetical protein [Actinomycetota bacterium]
MRRSALLLLSEDLIREFWARPRFLLETDAWVVERERDVVGYAEAWDEEPSRAPAPDTSACGQCSPVPPPG